MRLNSLGLRQQTMIGVAFACAGTLSILYAILREKSAFTMSPGVEGSLTAFVVGIALALSEGVAFGSAVVVALPLFVLQYVGCRYVGEPALGILGLEAVLIGLYGLLAPARRGSAALVRVHVAA